MREFIRTLHELGYKWGMTPIVLASCGGGADEHIQVWHPLCLEDAPCYIVFADGRWEDHPDAPFAEIEKLRIR